MALDLQRQALSLLYAGALGLLLGFLYDALRPPRHGGGTAAGVLLDLLFGLLAACAAFVYAMKAGDGRLGLWALSASFLAFLMYMQVFSPVFLPFFVALYKGLVSAGETLKDFLKKLQKFAKKTSNM